MIDEQRMRDAGLSPEKLRARHAKMRTATALPCASRRRHARSRRGPIAAQHSSECGLRRSRYAAHRRLGRARAAARNSRESAHDHLRSGRAALHPAQAEAASLHREQSLRRAAHRMPSREAYLAASGSVWNADALRIYLAELQRTEPLLAGRAVGSPGDAALCAARADSGAGRGAL